METFVIVGAGLAGTNAADELRQEGFEGRIVLIGEEAEHPYDRPPLSKEFLSGAQDRPPYLHDTAFYVDHDIELVTGTRVTTLDPGLSTVTLAGGVQLRYDRLLLATGSVPRVLPGRSGRWGGVRYLRTLADARRLRVELTRAEHVIVIGGGWIGTEIAAAVRQMGRAVTLVHRGALPLVKALGPDVARIYRDVHVDNGVRMVSGDVVEVVGRLGAEGVRLTSGETIEGDLIVAGLGARPRTDLARAAGLVVDRAVVVDEHLHASAPRIFAAGDVAQAWHPIFGASLHVEHWANALNQGKVAASNMLGRPMAYDRVPYLYSDQYDLVMEYSGYAPHWDEVVFRGEPADRAFIAFWLHDSRVVAGMNVNMWGVVSEIQRMVRRGGVVDAERLADPTVPLQSLADAETGAAGMAA